MHRRVILGQFLSLFLAIHGAKCAVIAVNHREWIEGSLVISSDTPAAYRFAVRRPPLRDPRVNIAHSFGPRGISWAVGIERESRAIEHQASPTY